MNTPSTLPADSVRSAITTCPSRVDGLEIAAVTLVSLLITAFCYVFTFFVLFVFLSPVVTILSSGNVLLGRGDAGDFSALGALPLVLFVYSLLGYRLTNGKTVVGLKLYSFVALWCVWTVALAGLAYVGILSVNNFIVLVIANAVAVSLGCLGDRLLPAPREKKIKIRTDLQWFGFIAAQSLVVAIVGIPAFVAFVYCTVSVSQQADHIAFCGKAAPAASYVNLDGGTWELGDQKGKVVLLNFMDRSSGSEYVMLPALTQISEKFGDRSDFTMASISLESGKTTWFDEQEVDWALLKDESLSNEAFQRGCGLALPRTFLIDQDGIVRSVFHEGLWGQDFSLEGDVLPQVEQEIAQLLDSKK